jgi:hypothetical protein
MPRFYTQSRFVCVAVQICGKTKVQCLVRNTHFGIYYARARVNGKLLWKALETDSLNFKVVETDKMFTPELEVRSPRIVQNQGI